MEDAAHARHNRACREIVTIIRDSSLTEPEAMVLLESVVLAIMLFYRPHPRAAAPFLDMLTEKVIERLPPDGKLP